MSAMFKSFIPSKSVQKLTKLSKNWLKIRPPNIGPQKIPKAELFLTTHTNQMLIKIEV